MAKKKIAAIYRKIGDSKRITLPSYRMPDGTVRFCYDPHKPDYRGFEPGVGEFNQVWTMYANESHGYEYHLIKFTPEAAQ